MLAAALRRPGTVLLDAPRPDADTGRRGAWLFTSPRCALAARTLDEVGPLLDALDRALGEGHHVAGVLSYEAGYAIEPDHVRDPPLDPAVPLAWFGVYDAPTDVPAEAVDAALAEAGPVRVERPTFALDEAAYGGRVAAIRAHIRAGDVYQINLTAPFRFGLDGDPLALFGALRRRQSVAYGAFVRLEAEAGGAAVASVSPELFFRVDPEGGGRTIRARPMKGTAPRGGSPSHDDALAEALRASPKDRAENLMIVDLLRNDLARVSAPGSVRVPALFEAERYETVTQMTSTVTAALRPDVGLGDVLRALFPCGSITGAPKLRAMRIIRDLEVGPRGVYCGAIGYAAPGGASGLSEAAFNVAIRTAVVADGVGRYDVGSGIVWDSDLDAEYAECLLKARVLTDLAG
ncbi:aminodeoxychorismate synthase component I [Rubrivirga marina]|uniref:aminodeoxychorismate synthase component I n=1 Tax=Rubrivirga marina TaxID=1196024 RepID=UPI001C532D6F|nr:aminodeoxychorismate synthase component I [Rubrivirga marina]